MVYDVPSRSEDREVRAEASQYMLQLRYREKFGLSWKEFCEEPASIYNMNLIILAIENKKQERDSKRKN